MTESPPKSWHVELLEYRRELFLTFYAYERGPSGNPLKLTEVEALLLVSKKPTHEERFAECVAHLGSWAAGRGLRLSTPDPADLVEFHAGRKPMIRYTPSLKEA